MSETIYIKSRWIFEVCAGDGLAMAAVQTGVIFSFVTWDLDIEKPSMCF